MLVKVRLKSNIGSPYNYGGNNIDNLMSNI
jgi:hypothetical protein